ERVGGQQQRPVPQVDLVHTQGAGECLQGPAAIGRPVHLFELPAQAIVDKAGRQFQEEVAAQGVADAFDTQVVLQEAVEDGFADGIAILGLGFDAFDLGAEGSATSAAGAVFGGGDVQEQDGAVGEAADGTGVGGLAAAARATV